MNEALTRLYGLFNKIYAETGRASIAPEKLMRALLLQVFYSIDSWKTPSWKRSSPRSCGWPMPAINHSK